MLCVFLATHFARRIHSVVHEYKPALEGGHLEEGQVREPHVVKGDLGVDPLGVVLGEAGDHVGGDLVAHADQGVDVPTLGIQRHGSLNHETMKSLDLKSQLKVYYLCIGF